MSRELHGMAGWTLDALLLVDLVAMALSLVRLARGPSLPDRVISMDVLVMGGVAGMAILAWRSGLVVVLDVAVAVALVGFLSVVAFAWYLRRSEP